METLDDQTIRQALEELDGWARDGDAIERRWTFPSFRDAIDFVNRVADLAEDANHHPELWNVYADVRVRLTSHDAGGITRRDLDLAARIDEVAQT